MSFAQGTCFAEMTDLIQQLTDEIERIKDQIDEQKKLIKKHAGKARDEVVEALYSIASETGKNISAVVRDDTDKVIFEAKLSLISRWRD